MLNEKDSSNELDAYEEDKCPSMALDANDKADDNPCSRNQKPASAAIGGALGGIGGRWDHVILKYLCTDLWRTAQEMEGSFEKESVCGRSAI